MGSMPEGLMPGEVPAGAVVMGEAQGMPAGRIMATAEAPASRFEALMPPGTADPGVEAFGESLAWAKNEAPAVDGDVRVSPPGLACTTSFMMNAAGGHRAMAGHASGAFRDGMPMAAQGGIPDALHDLPAGTMDADPGVVAGTDALGVEPPSAPALVGGTDLLPELEFAVGGQMVMRIRLRRQSD